MKRGLTFLLSVLMLAALLTACGKSGGEYQPPHETNAFDEANIVLQFGAVSDIHVGRSGSGIETDKWTVDAYEMLRDLAAQYSADGLSAVLVAGDLTDNGNDAQIRHFARLYEQVFDPVKVPLVFALGNHDVNVGSAYCLEGQDFEGFYEQLGTEYRQYESDSRLDIGCVHQIVNGYHFLSINPLDDGYRNTLLSNVMYGAEAKEWLDKTMARITAENPDQYVFVNTHPVMYRMAYGGEHTYTTTGWFTREIPDILKDYPQAVIFGGHVHFPIHSDLSIMQTTFTSLQCGSVNYMSVEDGEYRDMNTKVSLIDREQVHNGYLVQVDGSGNVRVIRLDFGRKGEIKYPFVLKAPQADGSHLLDYGWDRGDSAKNQAPVLPEDAISVKDNAAQVATGEKVSVTLTFKAGTDDDQVHAYAVSVRNADGKIVETQRVLADFYLVLDDSEMKTEWSFDLTGKYLRGETYEIMLMAADDWGVASNIVKYTYQP